MLGSWELVMYIYVADADPVFTLHSWNLFCISRAEEATKAVRKFLGPLYRYL